MSRPRTVNKHLPKYVTVIHGSFWYRPPEGESVNIGRADDEAALYRFMLERAVPSKPPGPTTALGDCFDRFARDVVPRLSPRTQKDYHRHLKTLRAVFGHMRPDEVEPRDVGRFLDVEVGKVQRNKQVAVLSAVYAKLIGKWYVTKVNPCVGVERNETRRRDRYITDAEYDLIKAAMPQRIQLAMELALLTGQRQGDILSLKWDQVSPEGIAFKQAKTGKKLRVGLSPALQDVLDEAKKLVPQVPREYVLRTRSGRRYTSEGFRAVWQRRMSKILKGYWQKPRGKDRVWHAPVIAERLTFHDIRAKTVSDSATLEEAFERAGHQTMAQTRGTYDRATRTVKPLK